MGTVNVDKDSWEGEVMQSDVPVLVDFWASWCGPCRAIAPVLEQIANAEEGKLKVVKVNVEGDDMALAQAHGVRAIPHFLLVKGGEVADSWNGAKTREELMAKVASHLV